MMRAASRMASCVRAHADFSLAFALDVDLVVLCVVVRSGAGKATDCTCLSKFIGLPQGPCESSQRACWVFAIAAVVSYTVVFCRGALSFELSSKDVFF
jgi:hypothetical protein